MWYANYEKKYRKQDIVSTDIMNDFIKIIRRFCKMSRDDWFGVQEAPTMTMI